ncbi:hypothetical protein [Coleofasciculus sp. E1-EBD-02]|uniref:hypothetical protein n=1 Tax=Coleofasciculus sp. E1-EBD-02 TaxID=3068481 RepID=UPI0032F570E3
MMKYYLIFAIASTPNPFSFRAIIPLMGNVHLNIGMIEDFSYSPIKLRLVFLVN